jgi:transposase
MKTSHRRCAGLDVHSDTVVACVRLTGRSKPRHEVRRFSTATHDLLELADWLAAQGVTHVAMEATGIYWKPVWHMLEGRFQLILANVAHIRNVPGRKSDVNDAVWISDLLAHGLIRASFVPPAPIQELRDLTRTRTQLSREVAQHVQRIQNTLEDANIKLVSVLSDIVTARPGSSLSSSNLPGALRVRREPTCKQRQVGPNEGRPCDRVPPLRRRWPDRGVAGHFPPFGRRPQIPDWPAPPTIRS